MWNSSFNIFMEKNNYDQEKIFYVLRNEDTFVNNGLFQVIYIYL